MEKRFSLGGSILVVIFENAPTWISDHVLLLFKSVQIHLNFVERTVTTYFRECCKWSARIHYTFAILQVFLLKLPHLKAFRWRRQYYRMLQRWGSLLHVSIFHGCFALLAHLFLVEEWHLHVELVHELDLLLLSAQRTQITDYLQLLLLLTFIRIQISWQWSTLWDANLLVINWWSLLLINVINIWIRLLWR